MRGFRKIAALLIVLVLTASAMAQSRTTININDGWRLFFEDAVDSDAAEYVNLPHTWNVNPDGKGYLRSTASYTRYVEVSEAMRGKRLFLRFGGVQSVADVYLNGMFVGEHRGGYTAFIFEITDKVIFGENNLLRVEVSNVRRSDVLPTSSDADIAGGIYRDVELIVTERNIISPMHYATEGVFVEQRSVSSELASGVVRLYLSTPDMTHPTVRMRIVGPDGYEVCDRAVRIAKPNVKGGNELDFEIVGPELWEPENPRMYSFELTLQGEGYEDKVVVKTGFRDIAITDDNRLAINGREVDLRGVGLAHDSRDCATAICRSHLEQMLATAIDMGANAVRSLNGPHAADLYDMCDSEGVLVWVDMPFARSPLSLTDICYYPTPSFRDNGFEQLREIVAQNYNHPSVVMWGLFNLVWQRGEDVVPYIEELNTLAHKLDDSRLTVGCSNSDGAINFVTDLIVLRQNVGWIKGRAEDIEVWCSQLAGNKAWGALRYGVCYGEEGIIGHNTEVIKRAERGTGHLPERRQTYMHERYAEVLDDSNIFWGVWVETLYDYASSRRRQGINHSGLIDYDHNKRKDAYYLYRAMWNEDAPTLHITDRRWRERRDTLQHIDIYSSEGCPTLMLDGDTLPLRRVNDVQWRADSVVLRGRCVLRATDSRNMLSDSIVIRCGAL